LSLVCTNLLLVRLWNKLFLFV